MAVCNYVPAAGETASGLMAFFDCQARTFGSIGYQTLAASGSSASLLLTALLTISVAAFGYRLLLGSGPTISEVVPIFVKIGIVLAFASSWPAYRTVFYDVVIQGPGQLAAELGASLDGAGSDSGLGRRLDNIDREFETIEALGVGSPFVARSGITSTSTSGFDGLALGMSRAMFLLSSVGAFAFLKISAGLLLALGPLFIAFLLFQATTGLFEGWLRALIFIVLGLITTSIMLGIELTVLEPWMADLIGRRAAGETIATSMTPLLAATSLFGLVSLGLLILSIRIGFSLRLPYHRSAPLAVSGLSATREETLATGVQQTVSPVSSGRTRAGVIVDSVAASQRREEHMLQSSDFPVPSQSSPVRQSQAGVGATTPIVPLGRSFRRTSRRVSASTTLRDIRR
ncbi:type IV secretion system protein [Sphingomonas prati]|uniref:Type IV secretion system protein VirB6 n=1 Tax=Sphingomonas prati TaxID=1843237 RepID=A0A7W9BVL1_9SPHN|nr:type IV secretion system protein [Sphingomonas prati]MBB5730956.1 type IV secretion system protein VirB6 [Sphingomonas prati]GGE98066.1 type VI secretion protein [Sphingomonas prati]